MTSQTANLAFVFPGQGSQTVGMGRDWYEQTDLGRAIFDRADETLGFPLSRICFQGPEEELKKTYHAQPGLFVCSVIALEYLKGEGIEPAVVAGHSLGEYSALYAAGVFDLATGLNLIRTRGEAMGEAAETHPGTMAAAIGFDPARIEAICSDIRRDGGIVQAANFNSLSQTVVSGERVAVERAVELLKSTGARHVVMLPVHGAFHSPLMDSAVPKMQAALAAANLANPKVPFLANAEGGYLTDAAAIRASLARQITSCVRWSDIMSKIAARGVGSVIEVGPGRVLSGLWRQNGSSIPARACGKVEEARALVQEVRSLS